MPITSISEKDIADLANKNADVVQRLQRSLQVRLARAYPKGMRIDSSNMLPLDSWRTGAHMVAMNYQKNDLGIQLNRAFFQRFGGCGYVLKPPQMLASPPDWPPRRSTVRCVTLKVLSLHQMPTSKESRPLYEQHHLYVEKLRDAPEPPQATSVSSPAVTVELFSMGGYCCTTPELPPPPSEERRATRIRSAAVFADGLHPHFELVVHCLAAEPKETLLRLSVQDLTYSSGGKEESTAAGADHSRDVVYEAVVLDALRPGYRSLHLRSKSSGCRVDMCCLYVHVAIRDVELEANLLAA